jgi:hypothetical protein
MNGSNSDREERDLDGLRLIALGRIPRCARCELYRGLLSMHAGAIDRPGSLPAPPEGCTHQVCAPLASRMAAAARRLAS